VLKSLHTVAEHLAWDFLRYRKIKGQDCFPYERSIGVALRIEDLVQNRAKLIVFLDLVPYLQDVIKKMKSLIG
jgi:hypothetical protein